MLKKVLIDSLFISLGATIISALIYPFMNLELNPLRFFVMSFIL